MNIYKLFYKYPAGKERIPFQPESIIVSAKRVSDNALIEQKPALLDMNLGYPNLYYISLDTNKYAIDEQYYAEWEYTINGKTRIIKNHLSIIQDINYLTDVKFEVPQKTIQFYRGDSPTLRLTLSQNNQPFIIPSGSKIYLAIKQSIESESYMTNRQCMIDDAQKGKISVQLTKSDTDYVGTFFAELSMDMPGGGQITLLRFDITYLPDVRRP